jgi:Acyclic terpene utilisation family protein AtuA
MNGDAISPQHGRRVLRVGNASGFYGDRFAAWQEMLTGGPLDVLTGDYLAELTMLILGRDRQRDDARGYARTFLRQMQTCLDLALDRGVKIVTNAGGLNPTSLAQALRSLADRPGREVRVGVVEGDAVQVPGALTANAYLGAFGIAQCLRAGADVVLTGRVTDASLVVGPAVAHFGWTHDDVHALAGATVAGHILECGAQATGGNFSFFTELPDGALRPGFPLAEIHGDGSSVITKHPGTGGAVTTETVTAQLLYEIEGPAYVGPDVVAHFDSIALSSDGPNRVRVSGVRGSPPPSTVKVGVTSLGGFRNAMTFVLCGLDIDTKAELVKTQLESSIGSQGLTWRLARTDHTDAPTQEAACALLTVHIRDGDAERAGRSFSQAAVELALGSYPGCTLTTSPGEAHPYGVFHAHAMAQDAVRHVAVLPDGSRVSVPPPPRRPRPANPVLATPAGTAVPAVQDGPTRRVPLGTLVGARSGDKGGDATLGVWARSATAYSWLRAHLSVAELKTLLPECGPLTVQRHELPNLCALSFVIRGLLEEGVGASTRFDPQAKGLGEWLRSRLVDIPEVLL